MRSTKTKRVEVRTATKLSAMEYGKAEVESPVTRSSQCYMAQFKRFKPKITQEHLIRNDVS